MNLGELCGRKVAEQGWESAWVCYANLWMWSWNWYVRKPYAWNAAYRLNTDTVRDNDTPGVLTQRLLFKRLPRPTIALTHCRELLYMLWQSIPWSGSVSICHSHPFITQNTNDILLLFPSSCSARDIPHDFREMLPARRNKDSIFAHTLYIQTGVFRRIP